MAKHPRRPTGLGILPAELKLIENPVYTICLTDFFNIFTKIFNHTTLIKNACQSSKRIYNYDIIRSKFPLINIEYEPIFSTSLIFTIYKSTSPISYKCRMIKDQGKLSLPKQTKYTYTLVCI